MTLFRKLLTSAVLAVGLATTGASGNGIEFESPILLKADDAPIRVDSPGYASPSFADLNGDGTYELLVGQFSRGHIKIYQHKGDLDFSGGEWLTVDGKPAEVPGVW
ncbi:MAG: hypothetical protein AAGA96_10940 [Verrucomicrobiota bacterium]